MRRIALFVALLASLSVYIINDGLAAAAQSSAIDFIGAGSVASGALARIPLFDAPEALRQHQSGGSSVSIGQRLVWVNLSSRSFDNRTSSYTVGSCAVDLASGANGGGQLYSRCLSPGCVENVMDRGWGNTNSPVYLH